MAKLTNDFFSRVQLERWKAAIPRRTEESKKWFYDRLKGIRNLNRKNLLNDDSLVVKNKPLVGRMFMFIYDAKTKENLPYFDKFPLIIMVGPAKGGFYGLNLHYLPPLVRAMFFDKLLKHTNNKKFDETTKFRLNYEMLKSASNLKQFQPCFKRYLFSHIKSKTVEVPSSEWELALFLQTDDFVYKTRQTVWKDSKKMYSNTITP